MRAFMLSLAVLALTVAAFAVLAATTNGVP